MNSVLVTGATGFLGRAVVDDLLERGFPVRRGLRAPARAKPGVEDVMLGDLDGDVAWAPALAGCAGVVHLAAFAHGRRGAEASLRRVNVEAVAALARAAPACGVERIVFASSVKAVAPAAMSGVLDDDAPARPEDDYGRAKRDAEMALFEACPDAVALRFPLLIGAGAKGNLRAMIDRRRRGRWMVVSRRPNRRSMLAAADAASAIAHVLRDRSISGPALAAHPDPLSTEALVRAIDRGVGGGGPILRAPQAAVWAAERLPRAGGVARRLFGDLEIRPDRLLGAGWRPATHPAEAAEAMARAG